MMGQINCPRCGSNRTTIRVVYLFNDVDELLRCNACDSLVWVSDLEYDLEYFNFRGGSHA